uniref:Uncharacterized protein n=1 Tax=Avena sativa TaxID=4498 RepID=A0ACD5XCW2_AVESA
MEISERHKGHTHLQSSAGRSMDLSQWRDWANLPDGPAGLLAERVLANDVADYLRFRAVCHPWRMCCADPRGRFDRRFFPQHWIMLREKLAPPHRRRFLNVSTGECISVDLPELHDDHDTLAVTPEGLLVLLHEGTHVRLLNPLTGHLTKLPPLTTLIPPGRQMFHWRTCILNFGQHFRACGSGVAASDSTVVLCLCVHVLGIAKPGDERWTLVPYETRPLAALVFQGRFYCVTKKNLMVLAETSTNQPPRMTVAAKLDNFMVLERRLIQLPQTTQLPARLRHTDDAVSRVHHSVHLVGCGGELMLVHCTHRTNPRRSFDYDVYRLDLDTGELFPEKSLNERALFLGKYSSLSVSTEVFPSVAGDTIYFSLGMDDGAVMRIEAYRLADGDAELATCDLGGSVPSAHSIVECLALCHRAGPIYNLLHFIHVRSGMVLKFISTQTAWRNKSYMLHFMHHMMRKLMNYMNDFTILPK